MYGESFQRMAVVFSGPLENFAFRIDGRMCVGVMEIAIVRFILDKCDG